MDSQSNPVSIGVLQSAGSFSYAAGDAGQTGFTLAVQYAYSIDLNRDGVDEVIFAGFETQPNTASDYTNTRLAIFGWKNGTFQNLTQDWLPGNLSAVQGVGDIAFGDFNGDGKVDAYLSAYADMDYTINEHVLLNAGAQFQNIAIGSGAWEHGVTSGDINGDGYDDVVAIGYHHPSVFFLGGPQGLTKHTVTDSGPPWFNTYATYGSGGAIGDFLGNGQKQIIVTDSVCGDGPADTVLVQAVIDNGEIKGYEPVATLPTPLLDITYTGSNQSHDVRARALDFNGDGLDDVIIFSRGWWDGSQWPEKSAVQFLMNKGGGNFLDVTSTYLPNYDSQSFVGYVPVIKDLNNDGLDDIFISETSWSGANNSTVVLLSQPDGTYREAGRSLLSGLLSNSGGMATLLTGPNGQAYLLTDHQSYGGSVELGLVPLTFASLGHAPSFTSAASVSCTENVSATFTVYTAQATDVDPNTTLSYSISGGADPNLFNIDRITGAVTFKASPNFEAPADADANNVYNITVHASDGTLTTDKVVAITVTDLVENKLTKDFNGDGRTDILLQSGKDGACYIWNLNSKALVDHGSVGWTPGSDWQVKASGDFNGDGKSDVLLQNALDGACYVWNLDNKTLVGSGFVGWTPGRDWQVKASGDFNGDGKSDILLQNAVDGSCFIWEMNDKTPIDYGFVGWTPGRDWQVKATGDFNGDGKSDVLLQNAVDGACYVWNLNNKTLVDHGFIGWTPGRDWQAKATGDFNGDGKSDVLLQNSVDGACYVWNLDNKTLVGSGFVGWTPGPDWRVKGTGDFNGDGKSDILLQNAADGACYVWNLDNKTLIDSGFVGWAPGADWAATA